MSVYDLIIIGAGPAGMTAAIYAARRKIKFLILSMDIGGQMSWSSDVENYPGIPDLAGIELVKRFNAHMKEYKIQVKQEEVLKLEKKEKICVVKTRKNTYQSKAVIIASGKAPRKLNVPGEEKFLGKGVSYCAVCLPPDECIITNNEIKKIKDVTPVTRVLTHDGSYKEITGFTKTNYEGKLVKIRTRFFNEPVLLTPNHPVYSLKVMKKYDAVQGFSTPEWVKAEELKKDDCVLYPIPKEIEDIRSVNISNFIDVTKNGEKILPRVYTHTSNEINDEIKINPDFLRLVGYYLAEGSSSNHEVSFYFKKDEKGYIDDVKHLLKEIFNLKPNIRIIDNVCSITIFSKIIAKLFAKWFGKYAHEKKLPGWMTILPLEKQREIIKGHWRGDGCLRDKDFIFVTSSRILAYQLRDLLLRQVIMPSIQIRIKEKLNQNKSEIGGRRIVFMHNKYHIIVGGQFLEAMSEVIGAKHPKLEKRKRICKHAWINDNFAIIPIRDIGSIDYAGPVLNLAVSENNTYVAKNFIVHNCDAPLQRGKTVAVIGSGNSGLDASLILINYAKKVYLIDISPKITGEPYLRDKVLKNKKITFIGNAKITEILGNKFVNSLKYEQAGKIKELKVEGVFVEIGLITKADFTNVKKNKWNEIMIFRSTISHEENMTSIPGIFAAGDCTDIPSKQIIAAAGEGCEAALAAFDYIDKWK